MYKLYNDINRYEMRKRRRKMKVKIKTWEEMAKDHNISQLGFIKTNAYFTLDMEEAMPEDRIINVIKYDDKPYLWVDDDGIEWYISDDMIEHFIEQEK